MLSTGGLGLNGCSFQREDRLAGSRSIEAKVPKPQRVSPHGRSPGGVTSDQRPFPRPVALPYLHVRAPLSFAAKGGR